MTRFLPKTIAGQTIIVLVVGLTLSHAFSMLIYSADRAEALALTGERHIAHRVAAISRLLDETPSEWREQIVHATDSPSLGVTVTPESRLVAGQDTSVSSQLIGRFLKNLVGGEARQVNVQILDISESQDAPMPMAGMHWQHMGMGRLFHGDAGGPLLRASVQLNDGQWANFTTAVSEVNPLWSSEAFYSMLLMTAAVILLSLWVIGRVTRPLRLFAEASERLGKDVHAPPVTEAGPKEIRFATRAFNRMQERLQRLIENRTRMLAAISHDLRTPITLLRLRAEFIEDQEEKNKMLATLQEMEEMISSTLSFAHEDTRKEDPQTVDLGALVSSITDDMIDVGKPVACKVVDDVEYECRPVALRRALVNVIENAVKYGGSARVELQPAPDNIRILIEDDGPGIPETEMENIFAPFYRIESSRNRETGGVGLGLAVARSIINGHGGDITVANRSPHGLQITFSLPR